LRARYWKLTPDEVENFTYDEDKLVNWDMKCTREPEEEAVFFGIFWYRKGIPIDYSSINGIAYYHNHIQSGEIPKITKFLKEKFGGKEFEKGSRIIMQDSKDVRSGKDIAALAKEVDTKFNTNTIITMEFIGATQEELKEAGMPEAKLLPIPDSD
jgi:hypothetical protein